MRWLTLCALAILPLPLAAQGGTAPKGDPDADYKALSKGLNEAIRAWRENAQKQIESARGSGQPVPAIKMAPPTKEFIENAQELADKYAGTDDAVRFLTFIVKNASSERNAVRKAVDDLAAGHSKSQAIGAAVPFLPAASRFVGPERTIEVLDIIIGDNADKDVLANAHLVRGRLRLENAKDDEQRAAAKADLQAVAKLTEDEDLRKQADGVLFEIEHLQVGCTVPEIEGKDIDGVQFKLSDYRGKVVMLDFWGFW
jgi:hypothetical protein